jgi:hypothetical protein
MVQLKRLVTLAAGRVVDGRTQRRRAPEHNDRPKQMIGFPRVGLVPATNRPTHVPRGFPEATCFDKRILWSWFTLPDVSASTS